jgi:hypothetical protein
MYKLQKKWDSEQMKLRKEKHALKKPKKTSVKIKEEDTVDADGLFETPSEPFNDQDAVQHELERLQKEEAEKKMTVTKFTYIPPPKEAKKCIPAPPLSFFTQRMRHTSLFDKHTVDIYIMFDGFDIWDDVTILELEDEDQVQQEQQQQLQNNKYNNINHINISSISGGSNLRFTSLGIERGKKDLPPPSRLVVRRKTSGYEVRSDRSDPLFDLECSNLVSILPETMVFGTKFLFLLLLFLLLLFFFL